MTAARRPEPGAAPAAPRLGPRGNTAAHRLLAARRPLAGPTGLSTVEWVVGGRQVSRAPRPTSPHRRRVEKDAAENHEGGPGNFSRAASNRHINRGLIVSPCPIPSSSARHQQKDTPQRGQRRRMFVTAPWRSTIAHAAPGREPAQRRWAIPPCHVADDLPPPVHFDRSGHDPGTLPS
jgi:hypothetical protein